MTGSPSRKKIIWFLLCFSGVALVLLGYKNFILRPKPAPWMTERICKDLHPFTGENLSRERLDALFADRTLPLLRIQIISGKIYWDLNTLSRGDPLGNREITCKRMKKMCRLIRETNKRHPLPDLDFVINLADTNTPGSPHPLFLFAKTEGEKGLLIPDYDIAFLSRQKHGKVFEKGIRSHPWNRKKEILFWRGSSSGKHLFEDIAVGTSRAKLVFRAKCHADIMDAKFSQLVQLSDDEKAFLIREGYTDSWIEPVELLRYKYLIVPDGNTCAFSGYYRVLLSNSVAFKQDSKDIQWFYEALKPGEHYIPVARDFSDLEEKLRWAREHDAEAEKIAENATNFIRENVRGKHIRLYVSLLLKAYARKQGGGILRGENMKNYSFLGKNYKRLLRGDLPENSPFHPAVFTGN